MRGLSVGFFSIQYMFAHRIITSRHILPKITYIRVACPHEFVYTCLEPNTYLQAWHNRVLPSRRNVLSSLLLGGSFCFGENIQQSVGRGACSGSGRVG